MQGCTTASGLSEVLQWNSKEHFGAILVEFVLILVPLSEDPSLEGNLP